MGCSLLYMVYFKVKRQCKPICIHEHFVSFQLYTIGSRLIVVCGTNIYICRFSIESNTLAAALGRQLKEGNTTLLTVSCTYILNLKTDSLGSEH